MPDHMLSRTAGTAAVWLPSLLLALLLSLNASATTPSTEVIKETLIQRFRSTTGEALYEVWHRDCHRRCRAQLVDQVNLACHFDPYKMRSRRSAPVQPTTANTTTMPPNLTLPHEESVAFLVKKGAARARARGHHVAKRGIMEECCYHKSCSWEEYAEFCHGYNRRPNFRVSTC